MSVKAIDIIEKMRSIAPEEICCSWDNVGVMAGDTGKEVKKAVIALDCSDDVIDEAIEKGADMIITHHPFIFKPVKNLDFKNPAARKIAKVIKNDILVYSAHTNLDIADYGTNYTLAELLELDDVEGLVPQGEGRYMGRAGKIKTEMTFKEFTAFVKEKLGAKRLVVNGNMERVIKKAGICTGAGADYEFMSKAKEMGCDVFITGDVGYHDGQTAEDIDICLIDGTHYLTEVIVVKSLYDILSKEFENVEFIMSEVNGQTLNII